MNQLEQLKQFSIIVSDSSDFESIKKYKPQDATTNPTLILQASSKPEYRSLLEKAVHTTRSISDPEQRKEALIDQIFVNFGLEILQIVPGRVSTEVPASLSFDTKASIERARRIISLYEKARIPRERILIKLAATWEGIRAAEMLEMEDIHCNMTLIFSLPQAAASAEAQATLISPFVGRILDWYQKHYPEKKYTSHDDPGVLSTKAIYTYLKKFCFETEVMGASFRNKGQILALAGCDLLTISPKFLEELKTSSETISEQLSKDIAIQSDVHKLDLTESTFRFLLNEDQMAVELLSAGIRTFHRDMNAIFDMVRSI